MYTITITITFYSNPMRREIFSFLLKATYVFVLFILAMFGTGLIVYYTTVKPAIEENNEPYERTFSIEGEVERKVTPDTAVITVGLVEEGSDIVLLQNTVSESINNAIESIKSAGLDENNIQTSGYDLTSKRDSSGNRIDSYILSSSLRVTLDNTSPEDNLVNDVISAASTAGLNEVRNLQFLVKNQDELLEEMKLEAIDVAKEKGEKQADKAGLKLGKILDVNEYGSYEPYYLGSNDNVATREIALDEAASSAPKEIQIQPGEFDISVSVTVVWELR